MDLCKSCELRDAGLKTRMTSALTGNEVRIVCVDCARKEVNGDVQELARRFQCVLRPIWDIIVVLRDVPRERIGRIIIPARSFDARGKLITEQASYGTVITVGPGRLHRIKMGERRFTGGRDPMPPEITIGARVMFKDKHEIGTTQWRGLALVHEFDVMCDVVEKQEAAAE